MNINLMDVIAVCMLLGVVLFFYGHFRSNAKCKVAGNAIAVLALLASLIVLAFSLLFWISTRWFLMPMPLIIILSVILGLVGMLIFGALAHSDINNQQGQ